jgi:16S rRNA (adenine1518-N6/adenine1519-N6)-dimethyltransferase
MNNLTNPNQEVKGKPEKEPFPFSIRNIKKIFQEKGRFPLKSLGQNFLKEPRVFKKILEACQISKEDTILEVGAGFGNLTYFLAQKAKKVIAVEKDPFLAKILKENLQNFKNIELVIADIRKILPEIVEKMGDYKIIGNLPYYLTAYLLRQISNLQKKPKLCVFILQKEVAQRICAKKGNLLSFFVQLFAEPKIISFVAKNSFWPQPKVSSAIILLKTKEKEIKSDLLLKIVKAGFSQPRKKLINNLAKKLPLEKAALLFCFKSCKIEEKVRAENLELKNWLCLEKCLKNFLKEKSDENI